MFHILVFHLLLHIAQGETLIEFIGCYEATNYDNAFAIPGYELGIENSPGLQTDILYASCEIAAANHGYTVFAIYDSRFCMTSATAHTDFNLYGVSSGCYSENVGGEEYRLGDEESIAVYQMIELTEVTLDKSDLVTNLSTDPVHLVCTEQDNSSLETNIRVINARGNYTLCPAKMNVLDHVTDSCDGKTDCALDYYQLFDHTCDGGQITVKYGCQYGYGSGGGEFNLVKFITDHMQWDALFFLAGIASLVIAWVKRHEIRRQYPEVRGACWVMHQSCPCLRVYPASATDPNHGNEDQVAVTRQYPEQQHTVARQPTSYSDTNPVTTPYPPPATSYPVTTPVTSYPANTPDNSATLPPPPAYSSVVDEPPQRRSGGWFTR